MRLNRIMLAAPKSGSGKTLLTCALLQVLKDKGLQVVSYKCGPDYIDPMFHENVIGIPSRNLDTFFTDEEITKSLLLKGRSEEEFAILEGVMGLYDGLGGVREEGSSYHLAKVTKTPIILVVDAKGMGRSVIALIAGFLKYDKEKLIRGVILNKMSKSYYEIVKPMIVEELQINVFGYFLEQKDLHIESRHLGLVMPNEIHEIKAQLKRASEEFYNTICVEDIMNVAKQAVELEDNNVLHLNTSSGIGDIDESYQKNIDILKPVIAVAKDEAFCFYYEENIEMLQENGAEIVYFSPLHDKGVPNNCDGILLGGGYPELYTEELGLNQSMLDSIRQAAINQVPIVAECGGFMYLHSAIIDKEGKRYQMAGVLPGVCKYTGKLVRFGYIEIQEKHSSYLPQDELIKGHEFHYYESTDNGKDCLAIKPFTGRTYDCVIEKNNCWFGFPHLYYPSNPSFAQRFVQMTREYKNCRR